MQFLGLSKSKDGLFLITEFVPRGDLSRLLYDPKIVELNAWKLRLQIMIQAAQVKKRMTKRFFCLLLVWLFCVVLLVVF